MDALTPAACVQEEFDKFRQAKLDQVLSEEDKKRLEEEERQRHAEEAEQRRPAAEQRAARGESTTDPAGRGEEEVDGGGAELVARARKAADEFGDSSRREDGDDGRDG